MEAQGQMAMTVLHTLLWWSLQAAAAAAVVFWAQLAVELTGAALLLPVLVTERPEPQFQTPILPSCLEVEVPEGMGISQMQFHIQAGPGVEATQAPVAAQAAA